MPGHEDTEIAKLLKDVSRMVTEIESQSKMRLLTPEDDQVTAVLRQAGKEALEAYLERSRNGWADLRVPEDGMEVVADFYPPGGVGEPLSLDAFQAQLEKLGVVHGLLHPVIQTALNDLNLELKPVRDVVVARGTPPVDTVPERWEIIASLIEQKRVLDQKAIFLDFKTQSPFVQVKKGDLLASRIPEQAGSQGWTVRGEPCGFSIKDPGSPQPGENVESVAEGFRATCDGCFHHDAGRFWVDQVLVLENGIGYETGHIDFAGEVNIVGEIAAGFHIHAKGSVVSSRVMDATEIDSGGDVITPFGIIGREGSLVKAEGRVRARFLENLYVMAKGAVEIQTSVLNCLVQTLDTFAMGPKGLVMGGKIEAQNGIDVFQVGSDRGAKAELICGMDFSVLDKVIWVRDQNLSLIKQLKALEAYKTAHPDQAKSLTAAGGQIREQIHKLSVLSRELVAQIDRNEEAAVIVRGTIFPGSYIEICHVSHVVSRPTSHTKYILDKPRGVIWAQPL